MSRRSDVFVHVASTQQDKELSSVGVRNRRARVSLTPSPVWTKVLRGDELMHQTLAITSITHSASIRTCIEFRWHPSLHHKYVSLSTAPTDGQALSLPDGHPESCVDADFHTNNIIVVFPPVGSQTTPFVLSKDLPRTSRKLLSDLYHVEPSYVSSSAAVKA